MMETDSHALIKTAELAARYCLAVENAGEREKMEFVREMLRYLPQLYLSFSGDGDEAGGSLDEDYGYEVPFSYVDEAFYDRVRGNVGMLLGSDDTYLEAFYEDMKYSETPVAASISEGLADIFQDLYNFISLVKDTEGSRIGEAFARCRENFDSYWGQILCNLMRPLHRLLVSHTDE